jgi:hypothetical protein
MATPALLAPHCIGEALELLVLVHASEKRDAIEDGNVELALGADHGNVCVGVLERLVKIGDGNCLDVCLNASAASSFLTL